MPSWPPSPAWATIIMPYVNLTYTSVYYELFGPLEKRLNRALRGRPAADERQRQDQPAEEGAPPAGEQEDEGIGAALFRLGNAVFDLFGGDNELIFEAEVRVGGQEDEEQEQQQQQWGLPQGDAEVPEPAVEIELQPDEEAEVEQELEQVEREVREEEEARGEQDTVAEPPAEPQHDGIEVAQALAEGPPGQAPARQNENQAAADDIRPSATLSDIVNGAVSSLLFPAVCFGAGEILRWTLPRSWTARPSLRQPPTGLLQQRWGRSLAGGCLFVVLRDAFLLYAKYKRAEARKQRKVKNVKRRDRGGSSNGAASS